MITLIIALAALAAAIIALLKKPKQEVVKETIKEKETAPADHPFYYSEASSTYLLDGNLKVTGSLSCLNGKNEESCHTPTES